mmetsp:Transcript_16121/g.52519  ORF Transcript_16121/g.52519 Transcript_16121/m.52519 type:complete len:208 (-) Transcript_16121:830-1453(-)
MLVRCAGADTRVLEGRPAPRRLCETAFYIASLSLLCPGQHAIHPSRPFHPISRPRRLSPPRLQSVCVKPNSNRSPSAAMATYSWALVSCSQARPSRNPRKRVCEARSHSATVLHSLNTGGADGSSGGSGSPRRWHVAVQSSPPCRASSASRIRSEVVPLSSISTPRTVADASSTIQRVGLPRTSGAVVSSMGAEARASAVGEGSSTR